MWPIGADGADGWGTQCKQCTLHSVPHRVVANAPPPSPHPHPSPHQVELIFNWSCRDSLRMITFNGKQHQDLWGFYRDANPPVTALKWTDLLV